MKLWITLLLISITCTSLKAQEYLFEAGATFGPSFYIGEVERSAFSNSQIGYGIMVRYNHNLRNSIKLTADRTTLSGSGVLDSSPYQPIYQFNRSLMDIGIQYEYNFFSFSDQFEHMESRRFSPYLTLGVGATFGASKGPLEKVTALNVPIGVGVKYKIKRRLNLGVEMTMRWTTSDSLDGIVNPTKGGDTWYKNTDWYSFTKFYITFDFGKRKCNCPRNDQ